MSGDWNPLQAAYTLNEAAKRQQTQTDALVGEMRQLVRAYRDTLAVLPIRIEEGVERALPNATEVAAQSIAANWTVANQHADAATLAYSKAQRAAPWLIFGSIGIGLLFAVVLGTYISLKLLPSADQITELRMEEQKLSATIAELVKRGGRTPLAYCDDKKGIQHLCVRVDENKKSTTPGYMIVYGH